MAEGWILITGASSDIGCALVRHLLSEPGGRKVIAHSFRSGERLAELKAEYGERLMLLEADCSDAAAVTAMGDRIAAEAGTPLGFIHLPALPLVYDRFTKFNWERFDRDIAIQVRSAVILLQRFLPRMAKTPGSRVVFVLSSVVSGRPPKFTSMYTTAKYALLGLMSSLAADYAGTAVRINSISPSMVETRFLSEIGEVAVEMSAASHPMKRNARPDDLLGALSLLLSPASDYIHGVDIPITGGI